MLQLRLNLCKVYRVVGDRSDRCFVIQSLLWPEVKGLT